MASITLNIHDIESKPAVKTTKEQPKQDGKKSEKPKEAKPNG